MLLRAVYESENSYDLIVGMMRVSINQYENVTRDGKCFIPRKRPVVLDQNKVRIQRYLYKHFLQSRIKAIIHLRHTCMAVYTHMY